MIDKRWTLVFEEDENGGIRISSKNDGFNSMELLALLDLKKTDVLAQLSPETVFKRVFVDENGNEFELKEEKE